MSASKKLSKYRVLCFAVAIATLLLGTSAQAQIPTIELVYVQGGEFQMGCTDSPHSDCSRAEFPSHTVRVDGFYMAKYEVTQALWMAVMGGKNPSKVIGDSLPVTRVSWYDAQEFIAKLNDLTGKKYRLPTEAEWEYAARGGRLSQHYRFSGSNKLEEVAWCKKNSGKVPHAVGTKQPNELGIYDMSGNVYEWCYDGFDFYEFSYSTVLENPKGYEGADTRVYRGGCMTSFWDVCRVSARFPSIPNYKFNYVGFRLALDAEPEDF